MRAKLKPIDTQRANPKLADLLRNSLNTDKRLEALANEESGATGDFGDFVDVEAIEAERDKALAKVQELEAAVEDLKAKANERIRGLKAELDEAQAEIATLKAVEKPAKAAKATKTADAPKE